MSLRGVHQTADLEVDFEPIGLGQAEAQFFRLLAHLVVIDGKAAAQDDVVEAVKCGAAEAEALGEGGEGGRGGEGGDTKNEVELRVDVALQADFASVGSDRLVGQIEIAAAGDFVGEKFAAGHVQALEAAFIQAAIENFVGVALDIEGGIFQEGEIDHVLRVFQVDQDGHAFASLGFKNGGEQAIQAEGREAFVDGVHMVFRFRIVKLWFDYGALLL